MFSLKDSEFVSSYTLKDYKNVNVSWLKTRYFVFSTSPSRRKVITHIHLFFKCLFLFCYVLFIILQT